MVILFVLLFLITLWKMDIRSYQSGYIAVSSTNAIKGVFAVIILYSHMRGYIVLSDSFMDSLYVKILNYIGQLMVAMFLFYSGYGIMQSYKSKIGYEKLFFKRRILKTLIHFDFAVGAFLLVSLILDTSYDVSTYITCWVGWTSIGNSNWFIFDILALYLVCFIVMKLGPHLFRNHNNMGVICAGVTLATVCLWFFLHYMKDGNWWVDTIFTFPLGMWYSYGKNRLEKKMKLPRVYYSTFILLFVLFIVWHYVKGVDKIGICSCMFCILIILLTMKVKFDNEILQWLGTHAFSIYILQRLPMIIFDHMGFSNNLVLFISLTIPSVLLLSFLYNKMLEQIDKVMFK